MARLCVNENDIDQVLNQCSELEEDGRTGFPGMTYEQGVRAALEWATGYTFTHPLDEE